MKDKIISIGVTNLFGFLNHNVELKPGGITLIHGPNACGKTTLFNMIACFFEFEFTSLQAFCFEALEFHYPDQMLLKIVKSINQDLDCPILTFRLLKQDVVLESYSNAAELQLPLELQLQLRRLQELREQLRQARQEGQKLQQEHQKLQQERQELLQGLEQELEEQEMQELREQLQELQAKRQQLQLQQLPQLQQQEPLGQELPAWLKERADKVMLHFIQTQRLLKINKNQGNDNDETQVSEVIEMYSNEIADKISKIMFKFAKVSQGRSFPEQLLSLSSDKNRTKKQVRLETEAKRFDSLLQKVEPFLRIVATKLRNKRLRLCPSKGFLLEATGGSSRSLTPNQLSSGEQHQIVLFYELIFKTDDHSFILIDGPEISLHVDWQCQFLSDLAEVAALCHHSFLIATHSPQIIGNRKDLAVPLDGGTLSEVRGDT